MPLYDYRCTDCGREVEVMHGIQAPGPEACLHCGGVMRKALSAPAVHFKGSGWAKKDAASASAKKAKPKAGADDASSTSNDRAGSGTQDTSKASPKGDSGSPSKSESKPTSTAGSTTD
jgi:putative FmdB family regulatory protein